MKITILTVGKKHASWTVEGIERYQKRLQKPWDVEWVLLPHSSAEGLRARQEDSERILQHVYEDDYVILLDEAGKLLASPSFAQTCLEALERGKHLVYVIGGAYGVDERVVGRADMMWSLSQLVFPHQLVRLILVEQLYRAQEISHGRPYHHE